MFVDQSAEVLPHRIILVVVRAPRENPLQTCFDDLLATKLAQGLETWQTDYTVQGNEYLADYFAFLLHIST